MDQIDEFMSQIDILKDIGDLPSDRNTILEMTEKVKTDAQLFKISPTPLTDKIIVSIYEKSIKSLEKSHAKRH